MFPVFTKDSEAKKKKPKEKERASFLQLHTNKSTSPVLPQKETASTPLAGNPTSLAVTHVDRCSDFGSFSTNKSDSGFQSLIFSKIDPFQVSQFTSSPTIFQSSARDAKAEQVIQNLYSKACQIIILSRIFSEDCFNNMADSISTAADSLESLSSISTPHFTKKQPSFSKRLNKWFNLISVDSKSISASTNPWKKELSIANPHPPSLYINIYLDISNLPSEKCLHLINSNYESLSDISRLLLNNNIQSTKQYKNRIILETWRIQMTHARPGRTIPELPSVYKKSVVFFRTLYGFVPLLPTTEFIEKCQIEHPDELPVHWSISKEPINPDVDIDLSSLLPNSQLPILSKQFQPIVTPLGEIEFQVRYLGISNFTLSSTFKVPQANVNMDMIEIDDAFFTPTLTTRLNKASEPRSMPNNFDTFYLGSNHMLPSPLRFNNSFDHSQENDSESQEHISHNYTDNFQLDTKSLTGAQPRQFTAVHEASFAINKTAVIPFHNRASHRYSDSYDTPRALLKSKVLETDKAAHKTGTSTKDESASSVASSLIRNLRTGNQNFNFTHANHSSLGSVPSMNSSLGNEEDNSPLPNNTKLLYNKRHSISSSRASSSYGQPSLQLVSPFKSGKHSLYSANPSSPHSQSGSFHQKFLEDQQHSSGRISNTYKPGERSSLANFPSNEAEKGKLSLNNKYKYSSSLDNYLRQKEVDQPAAEIKSRPKSVWIPMGNRPSIFKSLNENTTDIAGSDKQPSTSNSSARTIESRLVSSFQKRRSKRWSNFDNQSQTSISIPPQKQVISADIISSADNNSLSHNSSSFRNNPAVALRSKQSSIKLGSRDIGKITPMFSQGVAEHTSANNSVPNEDINDFIKILDTKFQAPTFNKSSSHSFDLGNKNIANFHSQTSNLSILLKDEFETKKALQNATNSNQSRGPYRTINNGSVTNSLTDSFNSHLSIGKASNYSLSSSGKEPARDNTKGSNLPTRETASNRFFINDYARSGRKNIFKNLANDASTEESCIENQRNFSKTIPQSVPGVSAFRPHSRERVLRAENFNRKPAFITGKQGTLKPNSANREQFSLNHDQIEAITSHNTLPISIPHSLPSFANSSKHHLANTNVGQYRHRLESRAGGFVGATSLSNKIKATSFGLNAQRTNSQADTDANVGTDANAVTDTTTNLNPEHAAYFANFPTGEGSSQRPNQGRFLANKLPRDNYRKQRKDHVLGHNDSDSDANDDLPVTKPKFFARKHVTQGFESNRLPEPSSFGQRPYSKTQLGSFEQRHSYTTTNQSHSHSHSHQQTDGSEHEDSLARFKPSQFAERRESKALGNNGNTNFNFKPAGYNGINRNQSQVHLAQIEAEAGAYKDHSAEDFNIDSDDGFEHLEDLEASSDPLVSRNYLYDNSLIFNMSQSSLFKNKQSKKR